MNNHEHKVGWLLFLFAMALLLLVSWIEELPL